MRILAVIAITVMLMGGVGCASNRRYSTYDPYYGNRYPSSYRYRNNVPYYPNGGYREYRTQPRYRVHEHHNKNRDNHRDERRYRREYRNR